MKLKLFAVALVSLAVPAQAGKPCPAPRSPRPACYLNVYQVPPMGPQGRAWLRAEPVGPCQIFGPITWSSSNSHAVAWTYSPKGVSFVMGINGIYTFTASANPGDPVGPLTGSITIALGQPPGF